MGDIFFLGIDPDYTNSGYAVILKNSIIKVGTLKTSVSRYGVQFDIPDSLYEVLGSCVCGVEIPVLGKTKIFGKTAGEVQGKAIGLAKCMFMGGYIAHYMREHCHKVWLIEPVEWNPCKRKKETVHRELFMVYPRLRDLREKRGNGVNDDSIDAVLIAKAVQKRYKIEAGKKRMQKTLDK